MLKFFIAHALLNTTTIYVRICLFHVHRSGRRSLPRPVSLPGPGGHHVSPTHHQRLPPEPQTLGAGQGGRSTGLAGHRPRSESGDAPSDRHPAPARGTGPGRTATGATGCRIR